MELYRTNKQEMEKIEGSNFELERGLQDLVENNLKLTLGIDFVASEFAVGKYCLDTIAYDQDTNAFVIIEYKKSSKYSVIDQGFAYLNTLLNHKADFALGYNEHFQAQRKVEYFDWTQVKVIFIAGSFTSYQLDAINNPDLPIELFEAQKYKNNYVTLNQIAKPSNFARFSHSTEKKNTGKNISDKGVNIDSASELVAPTEENLLLASSETIQDLYQKMKDTLLEWDPSFEIKPTKVYIGFRLHHHNVIDFLPQQRAMKIWINLSKGELNDSKGLFRDVSQTGHWGNGDYEIKLKNDDQLEYVLSLMKQGWQISKASLTKSNNI
ncbi:DUF5655 domain-containing protein [Pediococcus inopinatus]|uniref:DUF5655 domain-containing protein n=1 Tax=Pediococcus inopinatus TaxID=114090 RepID=A0ABZ0Q4B9_9LACO|nr:DUF5655 domain-containing protein [Pediococcus inopinatus]WPC20111.1 DUF5655 domain-containing protein [Pediococcus inopinatus]WPC21816.1 DUF5655 domain-containing protein [Pediococcus inopinatus]WPP09256.1 DUF5655 domain-containing protein [Pediococcus inopinatus]